MLPVVFVTLVAVFVLALCAGLTASHPKTSNVFLILATIFALPSVLHANEVGKARDNACHDLACQGEGMYFLLFALGLGLTVGLVGYGIGKGAKRLLQPTVGRAHRRGLHW